MNHSIIPAARSIQTMSCPTVKVYVDGMRRRDLLAMSWESLPAPLFGKATLAAGARPEDLPRRIESLDALPPVGSRVVIQPARNGGLEFRGTIVSHQAYLDSSKELLTATAVHELHDLLQMAISSSVHRGLYGQLVTMPSAQVRFNSGQGSLCSRQVQQLGGRSARFFSSDPLARAWTVADALAYLLAAYVPAQVQTQDLSELESLGGCVELGEMDVSGMKVGEAIQAVAHRAGLQLRAAREGAGLVIYRPGADGRRFDVRLQPAGSTFSANTSNLWRGDFHIRRRPWRKGLLALGQPKRYETTQMLQGGWNPAMQTNRWRDFVRSMSDSWPRRCDVFRKWVLNEHGWYNSSPWNLHVPNLAAISPQDFRLNGPRKFLPCISTNANQQSLGVVVESRLDAQDQWRQWRGPVWISRDECAIYLGGDALPGEFFQAALAGNAQVRVTATIEADMRIYAKLDGDPGCGMDVIDVSGRAAWRKVHSSSQFYNAPGLGKPGERSDMPLLKRLLASVQQSSGKIVEADLDLAWIDMSCHVGDLVESIDGRQLNLGIQAQRCASVTAVKHDFIKQITHLEIKG